MKQFIRSLWLAGVTLMPACDAQVAEPPDEIEPPVANALATTEPLAEDEIEAVVARLARIIELRVGTTMTATYTNAFGAMEFTGTHATLNTLLQLYRDGIQIVNTSKGATYEVPIWQTLADVTCIMRGGVCSHSFGVEIPNIYLDKPCGHRVKAYVNGSVKAVWTGAVLDSDKGDKEDPGKQQSACTSSPAPDSGGGSGSGGGGTSDATCPEGVVWTPLTGCQAGGTGGGGGGGLGGGGNTSVVVCRSFIQGDALVVECVEYIL